MSGVKVNVLYNGLIQTCGEGPVWLEDSGEMISIDYFQSKVIKLNAATNELQEITVPGRKCISLAYPTTQKDRFIGLSDHDVVGFDWDNPAGVKVLGSVDEGKATHCNDGHADRSGRFWFGTMGDETAPGVVAPGTGSLFCMEVGEDNCTVKKPNARPVDLSNGMDWSADNQTMYFIDSVPRVVYAFNYDATTGELSNQRVVLDFAKLSTPEIDLGLPDGCTIDAEDKLWVACYFGSCVARFDVNTGKLLQHIPLNSKGITSCCFGGPHMNQLFVTSANRGYENGGSIYRIDGLNARGLHASRAKAPKI